MVRAWYLLRNFLEKLCGITQPFFHKFQGKGEASFFLKLFRCEQRNSEKEQSFTQLCSWRRRNQKENQIFHTYRSRDKNFAA